MITVEVINPGILTLTFKYFDDYRLRVKSIGAYYDIDNKCWELPAICLNDLEEEFKGELFYKTPRWEITGEAPPDYSSLYEFDVDVDIDSLNFKLKPFEYQKFGIKFLIDRLIKNKMAFVCDSVGLGKTLEAIGTIKYLFDEELIKDVVIVCKKSLKSQWKEEIEKFVDINANVYVTEDNKSKRYKTYEIIKADTNNTITIVNYHILLNDSKILKPDYVIYDECHTAKKHNGEINKACKEITKDSEYCLFMTGTPIMSKPDDLYGIVAIKDAKYFEGSYKKFENKYIVKSYGRFVNVVGYKHLDELRDKIQHLIIRRTANEVSIDLPEVLEITNTVSIDKIQLEALEFTKQKSQKVQDELDKLKKIQNKSQEDLDKIEKLEGTLKGFIAIEQMIANNPLLLSYSKSNAIRNNYKDYIPGKNYVSSKYLKALDIAEEIKEADQKLIIFSRYETVVKHLADYLESQKIRCVCYYGSMNQEQRDKVINDFKYNDAITVFIATDAAAEGLNLQISNTVVHFDIPYTQAIKAQRDGRVRRAGSKYSRVVSYCLLTEETIDINIYNKMLETKKDFDVFVSADKEQSKLLKKLSN